MMLLVMAGKPVDDFIETLLPHVEEGDIIIDGGNSHFPDTNRRKKYLSAKGIRFVGTGVSGGEEGARYGPSIMPGGNEGTSSFFHVHPKETLELTLAQRPGRTLKLVKIFVLPKLVPNNSRMCYNPSPPNQTARPAVNGLATKA